MLYSNQMLARNISINVHYKIPVIHLHIFFISNIFLLKKKVQKINKGKEHFRVTKNKGSKRMYSETFIRQKDITIGKGQQKIR